MSDQYRNFMGYLWVQKEDNVYTIGINEDGLEDFDKIESMELPRDGEVIEADVVCATLETDQGTVDIYSPVAGTVIEVNASVVEEPSLIQDDPYEGWLIKVESEEDMDAADEDEDKDEDDDEETEEEEDEE